MEYVIRYRETKNQPEQKMTKNLQNVIIIYLHICHFTYFSQSIV